MKIGKLRRPEPRPAPPGEPLILCNVGPHTIAVSAKAVEEIRELKDARPLAVAGVSKVRLTFKWERKLYFIVDAGMHLGVTASGPKRLLLLRDAILGLSVDSIAGMAQVVGVHRLPRAFQGAECSWYRGLAVVGTQAVPVINPETLLTQVEWVALRNSTQCPVPSTQKQAAASGQ
jgi:chemotaxis protein histidine kinase CheA